MKATHTVNAGPGWAEAIPKDPTEENCHARATMQPEQFLCIHQCENPDGGVISWGALVEMLTGLGYELRPLRAASPRLKIAVVDLLRRSGPTRPADIGPQFYKGPNDPGPTAEELHDVINELTREGTIDMEMDAEGYDRCRLT